MPATLRRVDTANDEFQLAHSLLSNRRQRHRQRRFVVQGVRPLERALAAGWRVDAIWYAQGRPLSRWAQDVLAGAGARTHVEAAPALLAELSERDEPSELVAIVEIPPDDLDRIRPRDPALVVVLDRPASPGNLGSIVRSADAFGSDGVVVFGHAADPYEPQAVRASVGSLFDVPVVRQESVETIRERLAGVRLVGASAGGSTPLDELDLTAPTALVVGNEAKGLSWAWREACDLLVRIPIDGGTDSLNAAAAAAILLYEADRQRRGRAA
jgi:23S rRNA (uridine2479-2'-O)-methyltransferase